MPTPLILVASVALAAVVIGVLSVVFLRARSRRQDPTPNGYGLYGIRGVPFALYDVAKARAVAQDREDVRVGRRKAASKRQRA